MGLVIIGFLAIFMTGTQSSKEPPISGNGRNKEADKQVQGQAQGQFALEGIKGQEKKVRLLQKANKILTAPRYLADSSPAMRKNSSNGG